MQTFRQTKEYKETYRCRASDRKIQRSTQRDTAIQTERLEIQTQILRIQRDTEIETDICKDLDRCKDSDIETDRCKD